MAVNRYAGKGNQVDEILNFLGDNAYTRAWGDAMGHVVRPVDRLIASDSDRFQASLKELEPLLNEAYGKMSQEELGAGAVPAVLAERLNELDPSGGLLSKAPGLPMIFLENRRLSREKGMPASSIGNDVIGLLFQAREKLDPKRIDAYVQAHPPSNSHLMTQTGALAQGLLSAPPVAYGVPAAGVGLGAWGLADYLQSQQQAEKDSQLPLS